MKLIPALFARRRGAGVQIALAMALLAACHDPSGGGRDTTPAHVAVTAGDGQTAAVGTRLPLPVTVTVTNAAGEPLAGVPVAFTVAAGIGGVGPAADTTDAAGTAETFWTLGTVAADSQRLEARVANLAPGTAPVRATASAIATAGPPATFGAASGTALSGRAGVALADSLAVRVVDTYGNPVPGQTVAWSVTGGGGSVSPAASATSAAGVARTSWTLGAAGGPQSARATVGDGAVLFTAQASGAPPIVRTDSGGILVGSVSAWGAVSWNPGENPAIWAEWSTSPTFASFTATPQGQVTRTDVTSFDPVQVPLFPYQRGDTTTYYLRLAASNAYGVSRGAIRAYRPPAPPPAASNFRASFDAARLAVVLAWDDAAGSATIERRYSAADTSWYDVALREAGAPPLSITGTSFSDVTYDVKATSAGPYRIRRCNAYGCSAYAYAAAVATVPLSPPSGLHGSPVAGGGVALAWTDNSGNEAEFVVFRDGAVLKILPANTVQHTDFSAVPGTAYTYTVAARAVYRNADPSFPSPTPIEGEARTSTRSNAAVVTAP